MSPCSIREKMIHKDHSSGTKIPKLALNFYAKKYFFSFSFYYSLVSRILNSFLNRISNGIFVSASFPPVCAAGQQFMEMGCAVKPTKQTNNIAVEVAKHWLEHRAPERSCGIVCKTSQFKPSGNDPLQNSFLWGSKHSSIWKEIACYTRVTSNPKWSTLFLPSISHTSLTISFSTWAGFTMEDPG